MIEKYIAEATECDFKQLVEIKKPKSWLKSVSAFANGIGGTLFFGIDDNRRICGLKNIQTDAENISKLIKERIQPTPIFNLVPYNENGEDILLLIVKPGTSTPYYYCADGNRLTFIRIGNESVPAPINILNELILRGTNQTYDSIISNNQKKNFSFTLLEATYLERTGIHMQLSDYISFGLMTKDGFLTQAGELLADQSIIHQSRLFCTRWNGLEKNSIFDDALDDKEYSGSLIYLLNSGIDFIKNNSKVRFVKQDIIRIDKPDYAERAITEALVNALIHRDYLIQGSEIHIDIFDDRLEIFSPGGMYDNNIIQDLDINHIFSVRRNPVIADMFHRIRYMERRGSGLKKILLETQKLPGYTEKMRPIFNSSNQYFNVIIKNVNFTPQVTPQVTPQATPQVFEKNKYQDIILEFCRTPQSKKDILQHCGLKDLQYFRKAILNPLIRQNLLLMTIPDKPRSSKQKYITNPHL